MSPRYFLGPKTRMSTARSSDLGPLFWQKGSCDEGCSEDASLLQASIDSCPSLLRQEINDTQLRIARSFPPENQDDEAMRIGAIRSKPCFKTQSLQHFHCAKSRKQTTKQCPSRSHSLDNKSASLNSIQTPELPAFHKEIDRMFKYQLGPLTVEGDIKPVLDLWKQLLRMRIKYGRKIIADAWLKLSRATTIVARKMTVNHIVAVLKFQAQLLEPSCPHGLRLPSNMFLALTETLRSDRGLVLASERQLIKYLSVVSKLVKLNLPSVQTNSCATKDAIEMGKRHLERLSIIMPLFSLGLSEVSRRCNGYFTNTNGVESATQKEVIMETFKALMLVIEASHLLESTIIIPETSLIRAFADPLARKKKWKSFWQNIAHSCRVLLRKKGTDDQKMSVSTNFVLHGTVEIRELLLNELISSFQSKALRRLSSDQLSRLAEAVFDVICNDYALKQKKIVLRCGLLVIVEAGARTSDGERKDFSILSRQHACSMHTLCQGLLSDRNCFSNSVRQQVSSFMRLFSQLGQENSEVGKTDGDLEGETSKGTASEKSTVSSLNLNDINFDGLRSILLD